MYTIGQVSEMFHIPVSTLRYYDKEGLFPGLELEIKDIRQFMQWCCEGSGTYGKRRELFERQRRVVEQQLRQMEKTLSMIRFKCWYYEQALQDGSEERVTRMMPDHLPAEIQKLYDDARS